jgi:hypothetical protein
MRKWRTAFAAISFALALTASFAAYRFTGSAQGNAGDVWVDNVGQPSGPGHEQDPHLMCADINLWGNGLADASGTFIIDSWPPTGNGATAYGPALWTYNQTTGGDQVLAVIPIGSLQAGSAANGDIPQAQQGLHFKLQFVQDPQKHKTFWVNCLSPSASPTPTPTLSPTPTPTPSATPTPTQSPTPTPTPSASTSPTPTASPTLTPTPTGSPSPTPTGSVAPTATPTGSPSPVPATVPPVTLAGTGGGPGGVAGSGEGTTVPLAMILILVGGLLLARDAFRR